MKWCKITCLAFLLCACAVPGESLLPDYQLLEEDPAPSDFLNGAWTIVVLPDTQNYVNDERPTADVSVFNGMMQWVAENKAKRNVEAVIHVGDMTFYNTEQEWRGIRAGYTRLDGRVPYVVCEGNHDIMPEDRSYSKTAPTRMNDYFQIGQNPENEKIFCGSYEPDALQNAWYSFSKNGQEYLVLALEHNPRKIVVQWADGIIGNHPDHRVIVTVHAYMSELSRLENPDGKPVPHAKNDQHKRICDLVMNNPNVEFVLSGHHSAQVRIADLPPEEQEKARKRNAGKKYAGIDRYTLDPDIATGHRTDIRADGWAVHQILFNAQWIPNGGDGWMLLLEFQPDNKTVAVKTFSPYLDQWRAGPEFHYTLKRSSAQLDALPKN